MCSEILVSYMIYVSRVGVAGSRIRSPCLIVHWKDASGPRDGCIRSWWLRSIFCACPLHCKVHCRVGRSLGSCRLISVQPLIGPTIRAFSISSAQWVLEVLCCLHCHSFYQTDHSTLWWMVVGVNWLTLCQECRKQCFGPVIVPPVHFRSFSILENKLIGYADDSTLMAVVSSQGVRVTVAESLIIDLGRISEWCNIFGMKLNASKTKTMIVSTSRTMHP